MYFSTFDPGEIISRYYERWATDPTKKYFADISDGRANGLDDEAIQTKIQDSWAARGAEASRAGTYMHNQIELALNRRQYNSSLPEMRQFLEWVRDVPALARWRMYRTEWAIFNWKAMVAGQIDAM